MILIKLLRIMIPLLLALLLQYFGLDPDRQRNPHIHIYLVGQTMKFLPNCVSERFTSLSSILKERKKSWCSKQYHKLAFDQSDIFYQMGAWEARKVTWCGWKYLLCFMHLWCRYSRIIDYSNHCMCTPGYNNVHPFY